MADIKNTLENYAKHFAACPPWAITVHASGGADMIHATRAKLDEIGAKNTKILAVTVLTSIDPKTCKEIYTCLPIKQVRKLSKIAIGGGADGLVCSPQEDVTLRPMFPGRLLVNPGVRSPGQDVGDQKRIDTPRNAMANGANNLVMGRQILGAQDPVAEVQRVLKDELGIEIKQ